MHIVFEYIHTHQWLDSNVRTVKLNTYENHKHEQHDDKYYDHTNGYYENMQHDLIKHNIRKSQVRVTGPKSPGTLNRYEHTQNTIRMFKSDVTSR